MNLARAAASASLIASLACCWAVTARAQDTCPSDGEAEVRLSVEMQVAGRKVLVPFVGFFNTEAVLAMNVERVPEGRRLILKRPRKPPYTMLTLGRKADEAHFRVIDASVEEAQRAGRGLVDDFRLRHPDLSGGVAADGFKILPFVYQGSPAGQLELVVTDDGRVLAAGRKNRVISRYPWPTDSQFHARAYEGLMEALDLLAEPVRDLAGLAGPTTSERRERSAVAILARICATILPKVKDEFDFQQPTDFPVTLSISGDPKGIAVVEGRAAPNLEVKSGLVLKSYASTRRFCQGKAIASSVQMQLAGAQGNRGSLTLSVTFK